jgi:DNA-binding transcriptional MerR regulator
MSNTYSRKELVRASGVGASAIRHYVRLGLMPTADRHGSNNRYDERHLHLLLAIRRLRESGLRGDALAARLRNASREEILQLAGVPLPPPPPPPPPVIEPPPPPPGPPPRTAASLREAVDALVCTLAEALDASPRALRPALALLFARMHEADVTAEQAARVVRGVADGAA